MSGNSTTRTNLLSVVNKNDFPILNQKINGRDLVYLDNGASTQKPLKVIEAISHHYAHDYANIHRGVHTLSMRATQHYEKAREKIQKFINAKESKEIIFVKGTTEAINLVAHSFDFKKDDEIIISAMEHHSNIVPWQMVCEKTGAHLKIIPMNQNGELLLDEYKKLLNPKVKLVSVVHISNALGTVNPVSEIIHLAQKNNSKTLIDGAQAVAHRPVDVQELNCDFYAFSGHKMYGPSGTGVLYGKAEVLNEMKPYQGGGDMISNVTFEKTTYNELPYKFEAGTPNIADQIALGVAVDYLNNIDWKLIQTHEQDLINYTTNRLSEIREVKIIGKAEEKSGLVSFIIQDVHPHDVGTILDKLGIAVRAGHHCAQPVMDFFKISATVRASFGLYNTRDDVDCLIEGIDKVKEVFQL